MDLRGIGPSGAARLLAVGDIRRFASRDRFASWNGTAPLDASSGSQSRHRLSRAGNRRINRSCTSWPQTPALRTSHVPDPPLHSLNARQCGALT